MTATAGSTFSGYGGLDMAVEEVFGTEKIWCSDIDPGACRVLAHHWPDVPNLGDITAIDWGKIRRPNIMTGGFPCQDVSVSGKQAGLYEGTRTGLWAVLLARINALRPDLVFMENVRGLLSARGAEPTEELIAAWNARDRWDRVIALIERKYSRAVEEGKGFYIRQHAIDRLRIMERRQRAVVAARRADARIVRAIGAVLGQLADIGYDAAWCGLPASAVGAPHRRWRVFILAWPALPNTGRELGQQRRIAASGQAAAGRSFGQPARRSGASTADTESERWGERWPEPTRVGRGSDAAFSGDGAAPDPDSARRESLGAVSGAPKFADAIGDPDSVANAGSIRREGWPEVVGVGWLSAFGREAVDLTGDGTGARSEVDWGDFTTAIRQWERVVGRSAPSPTEPSLKTGRPQLSPFFDEWLMGVPLGHVTDPEIWTGYTPSAARNAVLSLCGNGVVPQQAVAALTYLKRAVPVICGRY